MARIPLIDGPQQLQTGNQTAKVAQLPVQPRSATGEALMQVAQVADRVMELSIRADDVKNMTEANLALQDEQMRFAKFQQENAGNEDAWLPAWQESVANMEKKIGELRLSPQAREQMSLRLSKWSTEGTIQVGAESFRQKGKNAMQSVRNAITKGGQTRDYGPARDAITNLRDSGIVPSETADAMEIEVDGLEQQTYVQDYKEMRSQAVLENNWELVSQLDEQAFKRKVLSDAQYGVRKKEVIDGQLSYDILKTAETDPAAAREMIKAWDLPETDKKRLEAHIETQDRTLKLTELGDIADKVATGEIKRGDDVEFKYITSPAERQKIVSEINAAPLSLDEMVLESLALESAIDTLDVSTFGNRSPETMGKLISLSARINNLPEHMRGELKAKLEKRRAGENPDDRTAFIADGLGVLTDLVKRRRGEFFDKNKLLIKGKEKEFAAFELEITRMSNTIKSRMPQNPTPKQAADIIFQVTGESVSREAKRELQERAGAGQYPPPLPVGGGKSESNSLIPDINYTPQLSP